ncbi:helix-turn-helix domain-containing protein [Anaerovorax odorimutans]|uniref:Helix-turn-helix domain-containing protein n=1 Tax=Anaerovorax odorimutans TaxID=109327 RepID=A0ABT1RMI3_9FIRM|nr:helix-turn-helix transcriptional regulator [Anaerovorax odorimutans]MCQ4636397.1 helix-turn-helix domain-containing protein [Anaerovorax odorimutans]
MNIGEQINRLRKQSGLSQDEFANLLKVSRQTVSNWENEKSYPDLEMVVKISEHFQISIDELLKQDGSFVKKIDSEKKKNHKLLVLIILLIVIFGAVVLGIYLKVQADASVNLTMSNDKTYQTSEPALNVAEGYFTVPKSDHLDIVLKAETDDGELHVFITDKKKQIYYQLDGQTLKDKQTLYFEKGSYSIQIVADEYTENVISLGYHLEIKN